MSKRFFQDLTGGKLDCFHSAEIAHCLHQQWLNGEYCDLRVVVEDRCYAVHKCIIACFSAKFCDEMDHLELIQLVGVTKFAFEKILEFLYKGKMSKLAALDLQKFQEIMKAADVLNASKVVKYCMQERSDLVQSLNRDLSLSPTQKYYTNEMNLSEQSTRTTVKEANELGPHRESDIGSLDREYGSGVSKDEEDPLRDSSRSLVDCLAVEGEIGKDLSTALSVVGKTLSGEELANLMEVSVHPSEPTSSNGLEENDQSKSLVLIDGSHKKFQCSRCQRGFVSDALLQQHMEKHKEDQYSCRLCGSKYRFEIALLSHMKEHKEDQYSCRLCGNICRSEGALLSHMNEHKPARAVCKICKKGFKFNSSLTLHMEKCHPESATNSQPVVKKSVKNVTTVAKVDGNNQRVDVFLLTEMVNEMLPNDEGKYMCPLCDRDFSRKWNLRYHILKHSEDQALWPKFDPKSGLMLHQCVECNSTFQKDIGLRRHMAIMHRDQYYSTTKPLALLDGRQKQKSRAKKPEEICCWCDVCGKGFKRRHNLKNHMVTHSSRGAGFQCSICMRLFDQRDGLNGHMWIHGGSNGVRSGRCRRQTGLPETSSSSKTLIEGEVVVMKSQEDENDSIDLTSQEKMPENVGENGERQMSNVAVA